MFKEFSDLFSGTQRIEENSLRFFSLHLAAIWEAQTTPYGAPGSVTSGWRFFSVFFFCQFFFPPTVFAFASAGSALPALGAAERAGDEKKSQRDSDKGREQKRYSTY